MTCARQHYPVTLVGVTTLILLAMTCRDVQGQTKPQEASNSGITKTSSFLSHTIQVDAGLVRAGQITELPFVLANPFDGKFKIVRVSSSCLCTAAKLDAQDLEAGKAVDASVTIKSNVPGTLQQTILVEGTVGKKLAAVTVKVMGRVQGDLELEQVREAWTIDVGKLDSAELELDICAFWGNPGWQTPTISTSDQAITATVTKAAPIEGADGCWTVVLHPTAECLQRRPSIVRVTVTQASKSGKQRTAEQQVWIRYSQAVQVSPQFVQLSDKSPDVLAEKVPESWIVIVAVFRPGDLSSPLKPNDIDISIRCKDGSTHALDLEKSVIGSNIVKMRLDKHFLQRLGEKKELANCQLVIRHPDAGVEGTIEIRLPRSGN
jgi:hypothetical protein